MLSIRQKNMLQSIVGHPEGISGKQLSEQLRVSEKTIRNDVAAVNRWLKELGCCISASQKNGYFIEEENKNKVNLILESLNQPEQSKEAQTPRERRFAVMDRVLGRPGISIYQMAERMCVSEQTLYKDIAYLERILKKEYDFYGLWVQGGRVAMCAPESEIRRMVLCLVTNCILESGQLMDSCLYNLMRGIVNLREIHTFYQYVEAYCRRKGIIVSDQLLYIAAWVVFYTNVRRDETFFLEIQEGFRHDDELADLLKEMNRSFFLELEECDLEFMYRFLQAAGFPEDGSQSAWNFERLGYPKGQASLQDDRDAAEAKELFQIFQEKLFYQYGISFLDKTQISECFYQNLVCLIRRLKLRIQIGGISSRDSMDQPGAAYRGAMLLNILIHKQYGVYLRGGELWRITEYLQACENRKGKAVRALVVYGAASAWYYQVCRWITEQFQQKVLICGVCPQYLLEMACREKQPDLLISARPMEVRMKLPQLTLSGSPSEAEQRRMKSFLDELLLKKQLIDSRDFLFSRVQIRFFEEELSLKEAARSCSQSLVEMGCFPGEGLEDEECRRHLQAAEEGFGRRAERYWFFLPVERTACSDGISICVINGSAGPVRVAAMAAFRPWTVSEREAGSDIGRDGVCEALWRLLQSAEQAEKIWKAGNEEQVLGLIEKAIQDQK